jgi:hypothetical protein
MHAVVIVELFISRDVVVRVVQRPAQPFELNLLDFGAAVEFFGI